VRGSRFQVNDCKFLLMTLPWRMRLDVLVLTQVIRVAAGGVSSVHLSLEADLFVEFELDVVVDEGPNEGDLSSEHPVGALGWVLILLVQDIASLEQVEGGQATPQEEEPLLLLSLRAYRVVLSDDVVQLRYNLIVVLEGRDVAAFLLLLHLLGILESEYKVLELLPILDLDDLVGFVGRLLSLLLFQEHILKVN